MHDYFDILGVARDARAPEIRRACRRRVRQTHPDIDEDERPAVLDAPSAALRRAAHPDVSDVAVDFVEIAPLVDRMRAAFFTNER